MVYIWNDKRIVIDSWILEQGGANKKNEILATKRMKY